MPRQLRNEGGIMTIGGGGYTGIPMGSRTGFGIVSKLKDRVRKLIPNEIASVAVKAAPLVAPFSPKTAALMRGIGRFDQRGSISDALKQGAATFAFGSGIRSLGGAPNVFGDFSLSSPLSPERTQGFTNFFDRRAPDPKITPKDLPGGPDASKFGTGIKETLKKTIKALPKGIEGQLIAGGITAGASLLASYFQGDFREQEPGETMEEYLAERKKYVGTQMRTYMDNYFANDPEYMKLDDAGRDAFVARYNLQVGGRVGYQTGGISMANTLAENIARNRAAQAAFQQSINPSREKVLQKLQKANPTTKSALEKFADHARVSEAMKGKTGMDVIPEYALQTGADFQKKFSNVNPKISAGLAAAYQTLQEGSRAILDGPGGVTLKDAYNTALDQTTKNIEGILAADSGNLTAKQIENRNKYLKQQGQPTEEIPGAMNSLINVNRPTMADVAGPATQGIIPGFSVITEGDKTLYVGPDGQIYGPDTYSSIAAGMYPNIYDPRANVAGGGMPVGIMRSNKAGVMERDYRETGGFVPVGIKEKADDVPAMLSKNEFVFTADAVRGAGGGSIEKGAQKMYDTMKRLEKRVV